MGIPWHGHKLLWDGNGTDKYVPWTTLVIRLAVGLGFFQLRMYSVIPSLKLLATHVYFGNCGLLPNPIVLDMRFFIAQ